MNFTRQFLEQSIAVLERVSAEDIEQVVDVLADVRSKDGRLFILGSGGGAGHASHAVCDFRKLCDIEAYAPYDNVSELTARVNDEGWDVTLSNWLRVSRLRTNDCLLIFSVGGGSETAEISMNLVNAVKHAKNVGARVVGIVGKDGGFTKQFGDAVVVVPVVHANLITPLTEGFQALFWHLIVSHPKLQRSAAKWESVSLASEPNEDSANKSTLAQVAAAVETIEAEAQSTLAQVAATIVAATEHETVKNSAPNLVRSAPEILSPEVR